MTRLVLDSNALRRGQFSVSALQKWLDAVGKHAEIFVPEVVIWEWAEHAASAHATLRSQLQEFKADENLYTRPTLVASVPVQTLVERIQDLLPGSILVWSPPSAAWQQAVMDQVLQIGSGERKGGVKTGAADSIVLACVGQQIEDRLGTEAVLLATNDRGLQASCERLFGDEVLVAGSTVTLLERLNEFEPAEENLYEATEETLKRVITDSGTEIGAAIDTFDMGFRIHTSEDVSLRRSGRPIRDLARLGRVDIVEIHDLRVAKRGDRERVGLADVRIFADVHMTELELRETSTGASDWVMTFDGPITHGFIDLTVTVTWDRHWNIGSVTPTGEAVIVFDSSEYEDLEDVPPFHADPVTLEP